jgi:hypothetical protein
MDGNRQEFLEWLLTMAATGLQGWGLTAFSAVIAGNTELLAADLDSLALRVPLFANIVESVQKAVADAS